MGSKPDTAESAIGAVNTMILKDFIAFLKPFDVDLDLHHPDNYYLEREWRKYGNLKFEPKHVSTVVIARGFEHRLKEDFPQYADLAYPL